MKLSILTATYNRAELLERLYNSIEGNLYDKLEVEWLIMDDGSEDDTEKVVAGFEQKNKVNIKFYKQENQGKMSAINTLVNYVTGELIVECDSDDYFSKGAFEKIYETYMKYRDRKDIYAFLYLKYNQDNTNIGQALVDGKKSTLFDLYFKDKEDGEKALVFISEIRKKYKYELESNEKFVTEASLFYRMDENYGLICVNFPIMVCEYQKNGYTNNNLKLFKQNPKGFFKYFEYILSRDLKGVRCEKKMYVFKHYILFSYLSGYKINMKKFRNISSKLWVTLLFIPGWFISRVKFSKY